MTKEDEKATAKLKLIHLLYVLIIAILYGGIMIGKLIARQETNTGNIKLNASKELLESHDKQNTLQFDSIKETMDKGFDRLDKSIQSIRK